MITSMPVYSGASPRGPEPQARRPALWRAFGSGDEACVRGSEEDGGAGHVIGITDAPERDGRGHVVEQVLLLRCVGAGQVDEARCLDRAGADDIHADAARLQIERPAPGEV